MLYVLNKACRESLRQFGVIASADGEKAVLLISDGVFLANDIQMERLGKLGVDDVYAAEDAVEARNVKISSGVEAVDYEDMAGLMEEHDKIVVL